MLDKLNVRSLPMTEPPIPNGGGRISTPAGEIAQIINGEDFSFLAYIEFQPGATRARGNHYHVEKTELLYLINGRLRAVYEDMESGLREERFLSAGDLVTIQPKCAHVYFALEYSQSVEISIGKYDPADTIRFEVQL